MFKADGIALEEENGFDIIFHPYEAAKSSDVSLYHKENLTKKVMEKGRVVTDLKSPKKIAEYVHSRLDYLPDEHKRFMNPHVYKVGISSRLLELKEKLTAEAIQKPDFDKE